MLNERKIYLHIGYYKTGTTSIQHTLYERRPQLHRLGIDYPTIGTLKNKAHHNLANQLVKTNFHYPQYGTLEDLQAYLSRSRYPVTVLSAETFMNADSQHIQRFADYFKGYDVGIIIYLRRQDQLLQSLWAQRIKMGRPTPSFDDFVSGLFSSDERDDELAHDLSSLDFVQLVSAWAGVFGEEHIVVRPYERSTGDVVRDFLHVIGVEDTEPFAAPKRENTTPSIKTLEVLRHIAMQIPMLTEKQPPEYYRPIFRAMQQKAEALGWNTEGLHLTTREQFDQVTAVFGPGNDQIARTYLERERLFEDEFVEKPITTFDIESPEGQDAVRMMTAMFESLRSAKYSRRLLHQIRSRFEQHPRLLNFLAARPWILNSIRRIYHRLT